MHPKLKRLFKIAEQFGPNERFFDEWKKLLDHPKSKAAGSTIIEIKGSRFRLTLEELRS